MLGIVDPGLVRLKPAKRTWQGFDRERERHRGVAIGCVNVSTFVAAELLFEDGISYRGNDRRPDPVVGAAPRGHRQPAVLGDDHLDGNSLADDLAILVFDLAPERYRDGLGRADHGVEIEPATIHQEEGGRRRILDRVRVPQRQEIHRPAEVFSGQHVTGDIIPDRRVNIDPAAHHLSVGLDFDPTMVLAVEATDLQGGRLRVGVDLQLGAAYPADILPGYLLQLVPLLLGY
ncbi:hypothetical protein ES703_115308 [subsurface metagenome]